MDEWSDAGFSLIEALVALVILAVSAVSLLATTDAHIARIAGLESRALAQFAAENRMAEIELGVSGTVGPVLLLGRSFEVKDSHSATLDPDLERIDLTVRDTDSGRAYRGFFGFVAKRPKT